VSRTVSGWPVVAIAPMYPSGRIRNVVGPVTPYAARVVLPLSLSAPWARSSIAQVPHLAAVQLGWYRACFGVGERQNSPLRPTEQVEQPDVGAAVGIRADGVRSHILSR
jgi:hypothetical protein